VSAGEDVRRVQKRIGWITNRTEQSDETDEWEREALAALARLEARIAELTLERDAVGENADSTLALYRTAEARIVELEARVERSLNWREYDDNMHARIAELEGALREFLAPWGPEHYQQLRRALAPDEEGKETE
jgi:hypothetical protein